MKKLTMIMVFFTAVFIASVAYAQDDADEADNDESLNLQLFRPSIFGGNFIALDDGQTIGSWTFHIGALVNFTDGLLVDYEDDEPNFDYIAQLYTADLMLAFGTWDWLSLGVDVPIHYVNHRKVDSVATPGIEVNLKEEDLERDLEIGDVRAALKLGLLKQENHWLNLALLPFINFPTGETESYLGEGRITGGGKLILEHDFGPINLGLNGGYLYRGENEVLFTEVADAYQWGAGLSHDFDNGLGLSLEYTGAMYTIEDTEQLRNNPMEIIGTLRYKFGERGPRLIAGAGPGLSTGAGTPAYRIIGGIDYTYVKQEPTEGTLTIYTVDQNDEALSAKLTIVGPDGAQTEANTDGEWLAALNAGQYKVKAERDGYESAESSVYVQVGQTSKTKLVLKKIEEVVIPPTVLTIIVTDKDTGAKLDSIIFFNRGTANEKKVANQTGTFSEQYEPGTYDLLVRSTGHETRCLQITVEKNQNNVINIQLRTKIEKKGEVLFATGSAVLKPESFQVLDDVIKQINELCEFNKIVIEGHTSSEGSSESNMKLSQKRAQAVYDYLVKHGIDANKLEVKAYGEDKPIATNDTPEGRTQNRRVEFVIQ